MEYGKSGELEFHVKMLENFGMLEDPDTYRSLQRNAGAFAALASPL